MKLFLENVRENKLFDGSTSGLPQIYCDFIQLLKKPILDNAPALDGLHSSEINVPIARIMWAHGTVKNFKRFVFLEDNINGQKAVVSTYPLSLHILTIILIIEFRQLWGEGDPVLQDVSDYSKALKKVRYVFNVFSYLKHKTVNKYWAEICNLVPRRVEAR